jgi:cell wall assembly regulator SMI1
MMPVISRLLQSVLTVYEREYPPDRLENLRVRPATKEEIEQLEAEAGEALPDDFREYLLRNGLRIAFDGNYESLRPGGILSSLRIMNGQLRKGAFSDGRVEAHIRDGFGNWKGDIIREVWWSEKWIPFAEDGCGNMLCIDCDPGKNGRKYQLLNMEIQDGQGPFASAFRSFPEFLQHHVDLLKQGKYDVRDWGLEINYAK